MMHLIKGIAAIALSNKVLVSADDHKFTRSSGELAFELNKGHQHRHVRKRRDGEIEDLLGFMVNFNNFSVGKEDIDFMEVFGEFVVRNYKKNDLAFMYLEIPESLSEDVILDIRTKSYIHSVEHELAYHAKSKYWHKGRISSIDNAGNYVGNRDFEGNGYGTHIYVLDSGIDDHPEFGKRIDRTLSKPFGASRTDTYDCLGHGTRVAGIAAGENTGIASAATLVSYALLDCDNMMSSQEQLIAALTAVKSDIEDDTLAHVKKVVINMSLGPSKGAETGQSTINIEAALESLGAVIIRAAGNNGDDACDYGLSDLPNSLAVGSSNPDDERAEHSNYGSCVDIFAPGVNITFPMFELYEDSSRGYGWGMGTSYAAPLVAGVAANIMNNLNINGADVLNKILNTATTGKLTNKGGSPEIINNKLLFHSHAQLYYHEGNNRLYRYTKTHLQNYVADCPVAGTYTKSTVKECAEEADTQNENTFEYKLYKTTSNCVVKTCDLVFLEMENRDTDARPGGVLVYTDIRAVPKVKEGYKLSAFSYPEGRKHAIACTEGTMFSNRVISLDECIKYATFASATTVNFELVNHTCVLISCPDNMKMIPTASNTWVSYSHFTTDITPRSGGLEEKCPRYTASAYDSVNGFGEKCDECPYGYESPLIDGGGALRVCSMPPDSKPTSIYDRVCYCHDHPIVNGEALNCGLYNNWSKDKYSGLYAGAQFSFLVCPERCPRHTSSGYDDTNGFSSKCEECPYGYESVSTDGGSMQVCSMPDNTEPTSIYDRMCFCYKNPIVNGKSEDCEVYNDYGKSTTDASAGVQFSFLVCPEPCPRYTSSKYDSSDGFGSKCGECPFGDEGVPSSGSGALRVCSMPPNTEPTPLLERQCYCHGNPILNDKAHNCGQYNDYAVGGNTGSHAGVLFSFMVCTKECTEHTSSPYDATSGFTDKCGECPNGSENVSEGGGGSMKVCSLPENSAPVSVFSRVCYCHGAPKVNGKSEACERYNQYTRSWSTGAYAGVQFSFSICGAQNIALYKSVIETTNIQSRYPASNLNDGLPGTFTHGSSSGVTSITIDLGNVYEIDSVNLWNRVDCCQDRTAGFEIRIWEDEDAKTTFAYSDNVDFTPMMSEYFINTFGIRAQYVQFWIDASVVMNVGELEVFGKKAALTRCPRYSSSVYDGSDGFTTKCGECPFGSENIASSGAFLVCSLPDDAAPVSISERVCYCHNKPTVDGLQQDCSFYNDWHLDLYTGDYAGVQFSFEVCPGYNQFSSGGCIARNELGSFEDISESDCREKCDNMPTCISFEFPKSGTGTCNLSISCTFALSVKDESDPNYLFVKPDAVTQSSDFPRNTFEGYRFVPSRRRKILPNTCISKYTDSGSIHRCSSRAVGTVNAFQWNINGHCEFFECNLVAVGDMTKYHDGARSDTTDFTLTYAKDSVVPEEYLNFRLIMSGDGDRKLQCDHFKSVLKLSVEDCAFYTIAIEGNAYNYKIQEKQCEPLFCFDNDDSSIPTGDSDWLMYMDYEMIGKTAFYVVNFKLGTSLSEFNAFKSSYTADIYDETNFLIGSSIYQVVVELSNLQDLLNIRNHAKVDTIERASFDGRMVTETIHFVSSANTPGNLIEETSNFMGQSKYRPGHDRVDENTRQDAVDASQRVTAGETVEDEESVSRRRRRRRDLISAVNTNEEPIEETESKKRRQALEEYTSGVNHTVNRRSANVCEDLPTSMNGPNYPMGCAGAVWSNKKPAYSYCIGGSGSYPWWSECCNWEGGRCVPKPHNVALFKSVVATTNIHNAYTANNINDGDPSTFTHSATSGISSITIDLGSAHEIDSVNLWNRVNCCQERTAGFQIRVWEHDYAVTTFDYYQYPEFTATMAEFPIKTFGIRARFVQFWINTATMNIGELEVFGKAADVGFEMYTSGSSQGYLSCPSLESYAVANYEKHIGYTLDDYASTGVFDYKYLDKAQQACNLLASCSGVVKESGKITLRQSTTLTKKGGTTAYAKSAAKFQSVIKRCQGRANATKATGFNISPNGNVCLLKKCSGSPIYSSSSDKYEVGIRDEFYRYTSSSAKGYLNCPGVKTFSPKSDPGYVMSKNKFIGGYSSFGGQSFSSLSDARNQCDIVSDCTGITQQKNNGDYTLRAAASFSSSPYGETSWLKGNPGNVISNNDVIRACKDDVMNIGASGFNMHVGGASCYIKACSNDNIYYSSSSDAYDVYIWMDSFHHERVFDKEPITMNVVKHDDLKRIRDKFPNPSSKFGGVSSSTFDVVNGGRSLPKFQEHFGYPADNGDYGYQSKRGAWSYSGLTDQEGVYTHDNYDDELMANFYGNHKAMDQVTGMGYLDTHGGHGVYDQNGGFGHFDQNGGWGTFDQNGGWGAFDQCGGYEHFDQHGGWGIFDQNGGFGTFDQNGGWGVFDQNGGFGQFDQNGGWGTFDQLGGWDANEGKQGVFANMLPGSLGEFSYDEWIFNPYDSGYSLDSLNVESTNYENFLQAGPDKDPYKYIDPNLENKIIMCDGKTVTTNISELEECADSINGSQNAFSFSPALKICIRFTCSNGIYKLEDGPYGFLNFISVDQYPSEAFTFQRSPFGEGVRAKCKDALPLDENNFSNMVSLETCLSMASGLPDTTITYYLPRGEQGNGVCTSIHCNTEEAEWVSNPEEGLQVYVRDSINVTVQVGWSNWDATWLICTKTCDGGLQYKFRTCNGDSSLCTGSGYISQDCNTHACTVNGGWSVWSGYSTCADPCNGGFQQRSRSCTNPSPSNGGAFCSGSSSEQKSCTDSCTNGNCINCLTKYNEGGISCYPSGREYSACARHSGLCGSQSKCTNSFCC